MPRKHAPADAAARIEQRAADGFSKIGIAAHFNTTAAVFNRWLQESPALAEAFERGRERERHTLHNVLYRAATEAGNCIAAMFLLKARHGYKEGADIEVTNHVRLSFTLPGPLELDEYRRLTNVVDATPVKRAAAAIAHRPGNA